MCRSLAAGGRRCAACRGASKREYQRALYLTQKLAAEGHPPQVGSICETPPARLPSEHDVAAAISRCSRSLFDYAEAGDLYGRLTEPEALSYESAVRRVGSLIGAQADALIDRRYADAGVTPLPNDPAVLTSVRAALTLHTTRWRALEAEVRAAHRLAPDARIPEELILDASLPRREFARRKMLRDYYYGARDDLIAHTNTGLRSSLGHQRRAEIRSATYLEVLSRYRSIGGSVNVYGKVPDRLKASFKRVCAVFPTEWIDTSNKDMPRMRLSHGDGRASYAHEASVITHRKARMAGLADEPYGAGTFADFYEPHQMPKEWEVAAVFGQGTYRRQDQLGPHGSPTGRQRWVSRRMEVVGYETLSEIVTDGTATTACHELTHRMEHDNAKIGVAAQVFRNRRTQRADGTLEEELPYGGDNSGERVRPDGFVDEYIGKTSYGSDTNHTEVVSVGAEAVFFGRFGGLVGDGYRTDDREHRDLILGLWATA